MLLVRDADFGTDPQKGISSCYVEADGYGGQPGEDFPIGGRVNPDELTTNQQTGTPEMESLFSAVFI
jgi:hypothetical protein